MSTYKLFFAGAGGQGILMMGQMVTYAAMLEGKEATFLPAYGPEMRGGTANCTVIVSDKPICCPLINEADALIAMNMPSLTKFEHMVKKGGKVFVNTSIASAEGCSGDYEIIQSPSNDIAEGLGTIRAANMVMLGEVIRATGVVEPESIIEQLRETFSGSKEKLFELNRKAFLGEKE